MKLVNLKIKKKSKKEKRALYDVDNEKYPYGLRIHFEKEQVDKIPSLKDYKVGDRVKVFAVGTIVSTRLSEERSVKRHSVEVQLEDVGIEPEKIKPIKDMTPKEYKEFRSKNK